MDKYHDSLKNYRFVLCPWGNGIDTHRIWETLYSGNIPVTKQHHTFSTSQELPIIFVDSYEEITEKKLLELPQGGTAVGSEINAPKQFSRYFAQEMTKLLGNKIKCVKSENFYHELSAQDCSVQLSGELKNLAVILMKISNDLRWMNSGPLAGLSEIELKALQPGSSIMPGKVNPVIPEAVAMASADVIGNDVTMTVAAQSGNFQLNVMLPVIAYNLLKSINLISGAMNALSKNAISSFKVNNKNLEVSLSKNPILVTL